MQQFLQQLINGLSLGSVYALVALGYTMVYGIMKLLNFAHGEVFMLGAFVGYFAMTFLKVPLFVAIILAMAVCAVVGVLIEKIAYRPLRKSPKIAVLITAIGMSFLLQYGTMYFLGADVRNYPEMRNTAFELGGVVIKEQQILIFAVSIGLMILLQFIIRKTKIGKAMRAVSSDPEAATLMGINVDSTISFTFALGSALAGAAGVLVGMYYHSITPLMGASYGLKAFVAAVFGGVGLIPGAVLGGFSIGIIEIFVSGYLTSLWRDGIVYALLIVILIVKPSGLLGKNEKEKV